MWSLRHRVTRRSWFRSVIACLPAMIAAGFSWQYPLLPNTHRLTDQGKLVDYSWGAFAAFVAGVLVWSLSYLAVVRWAPDPHWSFRRTALGVSSAVQLGAFGLMYPANAIDVFIYTVRSYLWTQYGLNPNSARPEQLWEQDGYVKFASRQWADDTSPYGPLWNHLAAPVTRFAGGHMTPSLIGFKMLAILAVLITAVLVYLICQDRGRDMALGATVFWLWNPLVLWEGVGNGHNDVVMMVFVMAALLAWTRGWFTLVVPLLVCAALVKYIAVIFLPLAVAGMVRRLPGNGRTWIPLASGTVLSIVVTVLALAPFFDPLAVFESARAQGSRISASPAFLVVSVVSRLGGPGDIADIARMTIVLVLVATMVLWMLRIWQRPELMSRAWFELGFVFLLLGTLSFRGWYLIWAVALASVVADRSIRLRTTVWSVSAMLGYGFSIWIKQVWPWGTFSYNVTYTLCLFIPIGVLVAFGVAMHWREARRHPAFA